MSENELINEYSDVIQKPETASLSGMRDADVEDVIAENTAQKEPEKASDEGMAERTSEDKREPSQEIRIHENVGIESAEIQRQDALEVSTGEMEDRLYRDLQRYQRTKALLWGEVYGVEESDVLKDHCLVAVLWNGMKVSIIDDEYFEPEFDFGRSYPAMDDHDKMRRRRTVAEYQIGARVCFIILGVSRTRITDGEFENEYEYHIIASRRQGMAILRDIWFLHRNRKDDGREPRSVSPGDIIRNGHVISVNERYALLECLGVETRVEAYNLTNKDVVENCMDFVHPGDVIPVRVRKLYLNDGDRIHLSVSGRLNNSSKLINTMRVNAAYLGHVDHYNKAKDRYTIVLRNGVYASASSSQVIGNVILIPGDKVSVRVSAIRDGYVIGSVMKL